MIFGEIHMKIGKITNSYNYYNNRLGFGKQLQENSLNQEEKAALCKTLNEIKHIKAGVTDLLEMQYYVLKKPIHDNLQKRLNMLENHIRDVIEDNIW